MYGILTLFSKTTGNSLAKDTTVCKKAHLYKIYALFSSMIGLGSLFTFRQNNKQCILLFSFYFSLLSSAANSGF